jgi:hypothetical protein
MESKIELFGEQVQKMFECKHAWRYKLKSVFCAKTEQWVAENFCRYMCIQREEGGK